MVHKKYEVAAKEGTEKDRLGWGLLNKLGESVIVSQLSEGSLAVRMYDLNGVSAQVFASRDEASVVLIGRDDGKLDEARGWIEMTAGYRLNEQPWNGPINY